MKYAGFPSIYRQGPGIIDTLGSQTRLFGQRPLVVYDAVIRELLQTRLDTALTGAAMDPRYVTFGGETCPEELTRLAAIAASEKCDFVIGIGGGKAQDAAKVVKKERGIPVVIVPTIASNDAATSRLAITYTASGEFLGPITIPTNPDAVLVDSEIVLAAPVRYFIAGIGDALSTWFEAEQCYRSGVSNFFGGRPTETAMMIARQCYTIVRENAEQAVSDITAGILSEAVERMIEANVLFSGIGFEGCGVAAAHAISQGFTLVEELHGNLHGEEVAVALLSQLVLEERDTEFIDSMVEFYQRVGIPWSLRMLGLTDTSDAPLRTIATFACRKNSRIYNMVRPVTVEGVIAALRRVEQLAKDRERRAANT